MKLKTKYVFLLIALLSFISCASGIPSATQVQRRSGDFYENRKQERLNETQGGLRLLNDRL
ncbi:MAG: hypothetical protein ACE5GM_05180 [bacterium]